MTDGDEKTLIFRTGPEFQEAFRRLDRAIDAANAREAASVRAGKADRAGDAADESARLVQEMHDLILDEIERHWAAHMIDADARVPEFPDEWRVQFSGRIIRVNYDEREVFKND